MTRYETPQAVIFGVISQMACLVIPDKPQARPVPRQPQLLLSRIT